VLLKHRVAFLRQQGYLSKYCYERLRHVPLNFDYRWQQFAAHSTNKTTNCQPHLICYVVHDDGGLSASVVHRRQAVIPLLSGRVPDFKLDDGVIQADSLCQECSCTQQTPTTQYMQQNTFIIFSLTYCSQMAASGIVFSTCAFTRLLRNFWNLDTIFWNK